jgi:threonine aldolase
VNAPLVDLRSDTVTRPTPRMREVMGAAEVGDDQLERDPTTRRLEERTAELLGKEAALFFPTGLMANQTALGVLGRPGGEVVVEAGAHLFHYEEGAAAGLWGVQLRTVPTPDGRLTAEIARDAIRPDSPYLPRTCALSVENTHLASGGQVMDLEDGVALRALADAHGLPVHMDGARLWNACAATGLEPATYAAVADTVMVCFSKGLGAPVGSALAGSRDLMAEAWRVRRRLGGAMRQSGIIAAGALHALDQHRDRLPQDHQNARSLAEGLAQIPGISVVPPATNIVMIDLGEGLPAPEEALSFLKSNRILMTGFGPKRLRAVTHMDVDSAGIQRTVKVFADLVSGRN